MDGSYLTIAKNGDAVIEVKRSKFIGALRTVRSAQEAEAFLASERKKYHDAKHHCSAYVIRGAEGAPDIVHSSDDGEPSGTAGRPILGQIDSKGLQNVLVVVVRYFGGVLLGVPGLIRAYKSAAADALEKAEIIEKTASRCWSIAFDYAAMPSVMGEIKALGLEISSRDFAEACTLELVVPLSKERPFLQNLEKIGIFKDKINLMP